MKKLAIRTAFGQSVEGVVEAARVVTVVVGQEDPADVERVDEGEHHLAASDRGAPGAPVSTMIGCSPRISIELAGM